MTLDLLQKIAICRWREAFYDAAFSTIANKLFVVRPSPDFVRGRGIRIHPKAGILMRMLKVVTTVDPALSIRCHLHEVTST